MLNVLLGVLDWQMSLELATIMPRAIATNGASSYLEGGFDAETLSELSARGIVGNRMWGKRPAGCVK